MRYSEFLNYVLEQMPFIRSLKVRNMFGGYGLYQEGHIFAIVVRDTLYLKSDAVVQSDFIEIGLQRFTYISKKRTVTLQYFEAPPEVFEESDSMRDWVEKALDASIRQSVKLPPNLTPEPRSNHLTLIHFISYKSLSKLNLSVGQWVTAKCN